MSFLPFALTLVCGGTAVLGAEKLFRIHNVSELMQFSNKVNKGTTYEGTTVLLESDMVFTEETSSKFEIIGSGWTNYFRGTFDGMGHVISNLYMNRSAETVGLFGALRGSAIKNIVMDSSCSVTSTYSSTYTWVHLGGIIGCISTMNGRTLVQNSVNMAPVTFEGKAIDIVSIGGVISHDEGLNYDVTIENCVNYGTVADKGKSVISFVGGVIGCVYLSKTKVINNCINYGTIIYNGTATKGFSIGGVVGGSHGSSADIKNCVNTGNLIIGKTTSYIANIVGNDTAKIVITHCFWTEGTGSNLANGNGKGTTANSFLVEPNLTTVSALSDYSTVWNDWILNKENKTVTFFVNGNFMLNTTEQIVLLPDLLGGGSFTFDGWYTDPYCTQSFEASEVTEDTALYALYGSVVNITFDYGDGTSSSGGNKKVVTSGTYGDLPVAVRTGYTFEGWFIDESGEEIKSDSVVTATGSQTITAKWKPNKYTVSFDVNGGDSLGEPSKDFTFDGTYEGLPEPTRTGYTFEGWFIEDTDEKIMPETTVAITENKNFTAKWTANNYTVSFDVNGGDSLDKSSMDFTFDGTYDGLPEPTRTGYTFDGWFIEDTDEKIESGSTVSITENKNFTAKWTINKYVLSLDFGNGTVVNVSVEYASEIECPENVVREGYTFSGWDMSGATKMPAYDFTIKAQWTANVYTVSFDVNGGDSLDVPSKEFTFDGTYEGLPVPSRTGYTFGGWFIDGTDEKIESDYTVSITENKNFIAKWTINKYVLSLDFGNGTVVKVSVKYESEIHYPEGLVKEGYRFKGWEPNPQTMPAENMTVTAQWVMDTSFVEIVFGKKDLTEDEISEALKKHTNADFTIERIETDKTAGTTVVIVKFNDPEEASKFVEKVEDEVRSGENEDYLRDASLSKQGVSYSHGLYPFGLCVLSGAVHLLLHMF